jgi:hypothetical protein
MTTSQSAHDAWKFSIIPPAKPSPITMCQIAFRYVLRTQGSEMICLDNAARAWPKPQTFQMQLAQVPGSQARQKMDNTGRLAAEAIAS